MNPTFLQIVDLNGRLVFHSRNLLTDRFPYRPGIEEEFFYDDELSDQKIRLGQFPIFNEYNKVIGQLTIAISRQESYIMLHNLVWVLIIAFPVVLLVLYFAASIAAERAIAPVHQLIRTASGISDATIGTRLDLPPRRDELYKLTETINALLSRIEKSLTRQKQFTSDASHEIRTPLAAIRGTLEVLGRKTREPEVYQEKIKYVIHQVDRLDKLLDQLLQLARMESGTTAVHPERFQLATLITTLRDKWETAARGSQISIIVSVDVNTIIHADKMIMEIILDNLVGNAIKYGRPNGHVYIEWIASNRSLHIRDDGYGIPAEHLPHIFDRFYRVDASRSSSIKGIGIGLSIVKKLADLQHISISVESKEDTGTTIMLTFPG